MGCKTGHKPSKQGKRHQGSRSDGEAFANGSSCVASSIELICLVTNKWGELSHLSKPSRIVSNGSIDIDGEASGKCAQHAERCQCNPIHTTECESCIHIDCQECNRDDA